MSSRAVKSDGSALKTLTPAEAANGKDDADKHYDYDAYDGGDLKPSSCTDIPCCIIFVAFIAGLSYILVYAFQHGDPRRLTHGFDWQGNLCGVDKNVSDMPYLYWCANGQVINGIPLSLNLESPICVKACPKDPYAQLPCLGPAHVTTELSGTPPFTTQKQTIVRSIYPQTSYKSMELGGLYCIPNVVNTGHNHTNNTLVKELMSPKGPVGNYATMVLTSMGSARRCWMAICCATAFSIVLGYAYLLLLRVFAKPLINLSIIILCVGFLAGAIFFCFGSILGLIGGQAATVTQWQAINPIYSQFDLTSAAWATNIVAGCSLVLCILTVTVYFCCQNAIMTAVGCIEAACECMFSMPSMLVQPLIESLWKLAVSGGLLYGFIWLVSCGDIKKKDATLGGSTVGGVHRSFSYTENEQYMVAYYIFAFFWVMEVTNALTQYMLSYAVVLWYYTPKPKRTGPNFALAKGFFTGIVYHLGTLAFGAFLIATLRFFRLILSTIAKQAQSQGNCLVTAIAKCCICCLTCFEQLIKFMNKNAYIDVAINSNSFCVAAKDACEFLLKEAGIVWLLNGACFIVCTIGVLLISCTTGFLTYEVIRNNERWTSPTSPNHVQHPEFLAVLVTIIAAFVAYSFMVIFDHTADTLLYAYAWNKAHGHNTVGKYATSTLVALTGYKPIEKPGQGGGQTSTGGWFATFFGTSTGTNTSKDAEEKEALLTKKG